MVVTVDSDSLYAVNKDLKKEDIQQLQEWLKLQPHIPPVSEIYLQHFLHACYYNNEMAKQMIDTFYTIRAHSPEFFENRDPRQSGLEICLKTFLATPLDMITPEGYGIIYLCLLDFNDICKFEDKIKVLDLRMSLWLKETGLLKGHVIIVDMAGATFKQIRNISLTSFKKILYFMQDGLPLRLKALHFINPVSFMDVLLGMMKPFLKNTMFDLIQIHTSLSEFYKVIPLDCLPKENGGSGPTVLELKKANMEYLFENAEELISDESFKADETKRPGKPKTYSDLFGVEGTFKKLDID